MGSKKRVMELKEVKALQQRESKHQLQKKWNNNNGGRFMWGRGAKATSVGLSSHVNSNLVASPFFWHIQGQGGFCFGFFFFFSPSLLALLLDLLYCPPILIFHLIGGSMTPRSCPSQSLFLLETFFFFFFLNWESFNVREIIIVMCIWVTQGHNSSS